MADKQISRHDFFQSVGRGTMLVGITGFSAMALHGSISPEECFNHNFCNDCDVHPNCSLPEKKELTNERSQEI